MPAIRLSDGELTEPYDGSCGVGKWDRFMTPGPKIQNGVDYDFNEANLKQIVHNFARVYSMRRLPLDYRHLAAVGADAVQTPEQNLAYYNALAVIWQRRVVEFWSQDPRALPPDPVDLIAALRAKFPRVESADGLWGFKCEVTPLGMQALPNMEQLSPLFRKEDTDEQERPIGYNLLNVSAVGVAFQNGTLINLGRRTVAAHALRKDMIPDHLKEKLKKHGMGEDGDCSVVDSLRKAFAAYMAETDDPKEIRSEMARAMGDLKIEHDAMSKMEDSDAKKDDDEVSSSDKSASMAKKINQDAALDPAVQKLVDSLTGQVGAMGKKLSAYEEREQKRAVAEYVAFAKDRGVGEADAKEYLALSGNSIERARALVSKFPEKTTMSRMTQAGAPVGKNPVALSDSEAAPTVRAGNQSAILHGFALSKKASELAKDQPGKTAFDKLAAAQCAVARQSPDLYK